MTPHALLFDLDNTLVLEGRGHIPRGPRGVRAPTRPGDADALFAAVLHIADERWRTAPTFAYAEYCSDVPFPDLQERARL